jgi:hypothetical protein
VSAAEHLPRTTVRRRQVRVAVVVSPSRWRPALVAHVTEHDSRLRIETVRDPGVLVDDPPDVIVVDDTAAHSDAIVARHGGTIPVVGIFDIDGAGAGRRHLHDTGVEVGRIVSSATGVADLASLLVDVAAEHGVEAVAPATIVGSPARSDGAAPDRLTNVLGVGGPDPSLACELAGGLAWALSGRAPTVLVDLDPGRLVAARFGVQLQPNVCDAARALGVRRDADLFAFTSWRGVSNVQLPFWVLPGAPTSQQSHALTPAERDAIVTRSSQMFPAVVTTLDRAGLAAWDAASAVAARCSHLFVATTPAPNAVPYLLDWLGDLLAGCHPDSGPAVLPAITVVTVGHASRRRRAQLEAEFADCFGATPSLRHRHLPARAGRVADARWRADLVAGPFRRQCRQLVAEVLALVPDVDEPIEPQPIEPQPIESVIESRPVEPEPTEPQPVEPQPVEPQPVEPQPTDVTVPGDEAVDDLVESAGGER